MTAPVCEPFRYSGDIKIGHWTSDTVFGGYDNPVNFTEFQIQPDGDMIIQTDTGIQYFGQAKRVAYQPKPTKLTLGLDEFNLELLADVLRGTSASFSQSASEGGTFTVTLIKDKWVDLGAMNIARPAIATLALDTDFTVDLILGQIMALTVGAVGSKTVTWDQGAIAGNKIVAGNTAPIVVGFKGRVKEHNSGTTGVIEVPKVVIDPKTALAIIGGKGNQEIKYDAFLISPGGSIPMFTFYPDLAFTAVPAHTP
jgi:hypothetical protein